MADIPVTTVTRDGVALATAVAGTGAAQALPANDGNVLLEAVNGTSGSLTVTVTPQATVGGLALATVSVVVPANATRYLGPWPPAVFHAANGAAVISAPSGLSLRALKL
mgnify:CR=1 FL=1